MKPRGRLENLASTVGDLAGAVRRRRDERPDRVRILDAGGRGIVLDPDEEPARQLIAAARALIAATDAPGAAPSGTATAVDDEPRPEPPGGDAPATPPAETP